MLSKPDLLNLDKDQLATMLADSTTIVELQRLHIQELKDETARSAALLADYKRQIREAAEEIDHLHHRAYQNRRDLEQAIENGRDARRELAAYKEQEYIAREAKQQEQYKPKKSWYTSWFGGV